MVQLILLYAQAKLAMTQAQNDSVAGLDGFQIKFLSILLSHNSKCDADTDLLKCLSIFTT